MKLFQVQLKQNPEILCNIQLYIENYHIEIISSAVKKNPEILCNIQLYIENYHIEIFIEICSSWILL
jgi:hypothetical protein